MSNAATVYLQAKDQNLNRQLSSSQAAIQRFGSSVKKVFLTLGAAIAVKKIFDFGNKMLALYAEQERAETKMASVVKATGGAAGFTAEQFNQMAAALQNITRTGDEVYLSVMAVIATFKNIRGDQFKEATLLAADMAEVMGSDLQGAAMQVAKALNDPLQGITALRRTGVQFTQQQKAQIEAMLAVNDVVGAQQIILEELRNEFGGAATAAAETFSGKMQQLKNRIGDVGEQIGKGLIPLVSGLGVVFENAATFMENFIPVFHSTTSAMADMGKVIYEWLQPALQALLEVWAASFSAAVVVIKRWQDIAMVAFLNVELAIVQLWESAKHFIGETIPHLLLWFSRNWQQIFIDLANMTGTITTNMFTNLVDFFKSVWSWLKGNGTDWKWTSLTEGFESTLEELPILAQRQKSGLEKALGKQISDLSKPIVDDWASLYKDVLGSYKTTFEKKEAPKLEDIMGTGSDVYDAGLVEKQAKEKTTKEKSAKAKKSAASKTKEEEKQSVSFEDLDSLNKRIQSAAATASMDAQMLDQMKKAEDTRQRIGDVVARSLDTFTNIGNILKDESKDPKLGEMVKQLRVQEKIRDGIVTSKTVLNQIAKFLPKVGALK